MGCPRSRRSAVNNIRSTLAAVWRLAIPYFNSEDRWAGRGLLAAVIALELGYVAITVLVNRWNSNFFNALQDRDLASFTYLLGYFAILATMAVIVQVDQLYLNQWLRIRWRRWLTDKFLARWLAHRTSWHVARAPDAPDNPDQRIAEDLRLFVTPLVNLFERECNIVELDRRTTAHVVHADRTRPRDHEIYRLIRVEDADAEGDDLPGRKPSVAGGPFARGQALEQCQHQHQLEFARR